MLIDLRIDLNGDVLCSSLLLDNPYSQTIDIGTRGVVQSAKSLLVTVDDTFYESSEPLFPCVQSGHGSIRTFDARSAPPGQSVRYLLGTHF
jgi:hypothetical protein